MPTRQYLSIVNLVSQKNNRENSSIGRLELTVLLKAEDQFQSLEEARVFNPDIVPIEYQQVRNTFTPL